MSTTYSTGTSAIALTAPFAVLLWAAPDLELKLNNILSLLILIFITSEISIPNFYAIPITGLGWINLRKVVNILLLILVAVSYATSAQTRSNALTKLNDNKVVLGSAFGFLTMMILSIPLSSNLAASIAYLPQVFTTWYVILAAVLAVDRLKLNLNSIFRCLILNIIFVALICLIERYLKRRVMFDIMPASLIRSLLENPSFQMIYLSLGIRSGAFRAAASFTTPLSTGECAGMVMPIAFYFAFEVKGKLDKALGYFGVLSVFIILITTSARGAILSSVVVAIVYFIIYVLRRQRSNSVSLLPALLSFVSLLLLPGVALTKRFQYTVFGGGATAASNEGRTEQLRLAIPKIIGSPLAGHGVGTSADVVGYSPGNYVTLDSGILAVLVDLGLPGFAFFLTMIIYPSVRAISVANSNRIETSAGEGIALGLCLGSFGINTLVLAQIENYGLTFLFVGLFASWYTSLQN